MKKIFENNGETLIETIASTVIITLMMIMVAGAVVAAARVNSRADNSVNSLNVKDAATVSGVTFTLKFADASAGRTGSSSLTDYTQEMNGAPGASIVYHDHQEGKHDFYFFE